MTMRLLVLCACLALAAGCTGGSRGSSVVPSVPVKTAKGTGSATFVITVPKQSSQQSTSSTLRPSTRRFAPAQGVRSGVRPQYISPATQSITIVINNTTTGQNGVVNETAGLTPTSAGCQSTLASTVCTLTISGLQADSYTATLTTYDGANGTGNVLSAAQAVAFTITAGENDTIGLTLSGVPVKTLVLPADATTQANSNGDYGLIGQGAHKFIAESLDADGDIIAGPGAPLFTIGTPTGSLAGVTTAPSTTTTLAPNSFTVTPPATYASGTASFPVTPTFAGQATDGCAQIGANCSSVTVTVDMAAVAPPPVYVTNLLNATVTGYDENGNPQTLTGSFPGLCYPIGIAYDPSNGFLYVLNEYCGNAMAYDRNGNLQTLSGSFSGLSDGVGIAYDSNNGFLYVVTNPGYDGCSVGMGNEVLAFDHNGNPQTLSGPFNGLFCLPGGIAYDPSNGFLYVVDGLNTPGAPGVIAYDQNGNQQTLSGSFSGLAGTGQDAIAYDSSNGFLYVTSIFNNTVTAYDQNGNQQTLTGSFSGLNYPDAIAYDPSNGFLYVVNAGNKTVTAYDQNGNRQTLTGSFPGLNDPTGIAIVP